MNDQEKRTLDMFKRVRDFGATYETAIPEGSLARELFSAIDSAIIELKEHAIKETAGRGRARQGTANKAVARAAILEDLGILRRTARAISVNSPGLEDKFRLPHKGDDQELLNTARTALSEAEPLREEFLRREVQERIFVELEENIAAFEKAFTGQHTGKEASAAAGASIDDAVERGLNALRQLDPIIRNKFHYNPAALTAWLSAKRIERAPRRNHKNNNDTSPPAPQTPNPEPTDAPTPPDDKT